MITVFGGSTSRSLRVVWLLEEMGLPCTIRPVDMLADERDAGLMAVNPAYYIPVMQDGDVTMVESIAIMEYLMARHAPTPLALKAGDPNFAYYQQFLHLGEAGLATLMMPVIVSGFLAPEAERNDWTARWALECVENRMKLVRRQLEQAPYMAGEAFTAADISVSYALDLSQKTKIGLKLGEPELDYLARTQARPAYQRALEKSEAVMAPA